MKLSKLMFAVAALTAGSMATAAPLASEIVRISGASAVKANFARALDSLCTDASGAMREWISGSNISTYVCFAPGAVGRTSGTTGTYASAPPTDFVKFAGTDFSEVRLNVAGGSFTALQTLAGGTDRYLDPALGAAVVAGGNVNAGVTGGGLAVEAGVGGFSDVNYDAFTATTRATVANLDDAVANNYTALAGVAQGFGVAASDALWQAMYTAQRNAGTIPSSLCAAVPTATEFANPLCAPSISKAQMASIMSSAGGSVAKTQGAQFLASQLGAGLELRYVRRVDTSGTQAAAQAYFLGLGSMTGSLNVIIDPSRRTQAGATTATTGCNIGDLRGPAATNLEVDAAFVANGQIDLCDTKISNLRVLAAPGTGDVRNELNKATIQGGAVNYALGVMSLENDQATFTPVGGGAAVPTTWKWLRIDGVNGAFPNANPGPNTNRQPMIDGRYDFYYELYGYVQGGSGDPVPVLIDAIIGKLATGAALDGLTVIGTGAGQQPWNRGGRTDKPSSR